MPVEDELSDLVAALMEQPERHGTPEALTMLRVLAVVGPSEVHSAAAGAADRLVQDGPIDPPWVTGLGRPRVGRCFGYADTRGAQEAIVITFAYGRQAVFQLGAALDGTGAGVVWLCLRLLVGLLTVGGWWLERDVDDLGSRVVFGLGVGGVGGFVGPGQLDVVGEGGQQAAGP